MWNPARKMPLCFSDSVAFPYFLDSPVYFSHGRLRESLFRLFMLRAQHFLIACQQVTWRILSMP